MVNQTTFFAQNVNGVNFYFSHYNHSGNFKQHLLKHERESGSISAMLVAKSKDGTGFDLSDIIQVFHTFFYFLQAWPFFPLIWLFGRAKNIRLP